MAEKTVVYQDGKQSRGVPAKIIKRANKRLLIEFEHEEFIGTEWLPVKTTCWFKRKRKEEGGAYECADYNYWYYPKR